MVEHSKTE